MKVYCRPVLLVSLAFLCALSLLAGCAAQEKDGGGGKPAGPYDFQRPAPPLYPPLLFHFSVYDHHVMVRFRGHPAFVTAEVMWDERKGAVVPRRGILTRRDGSQVHVAPSRSEADRIRREERQEDVRVGDLDGSFASRDGRETARASLAVAGLARVDMEAFLHGPPVDGLADPKGRGAGRYLPVILRGRSRLGSKESRIRVDGKSYPIPLEVDSPFFQGAAAFHTAGLKLGILGSGRVSLRPVAPEAGAGNPGTWTYDTRAGRIVVKIRGSAGTSCQGECGSLLMAGAYRSGVFETEGLGARDRVRAGERTPVLGLVFSPPLPRLARLRDGVAVKGTFRIRLVGQEKPLVEGTYEGKGSAGRTELLLAPAEPSWAAKRVVRVTQSWDGTILDVRAEVFAPKK